MPYSKMSDRSNPGCILFLLDQSGSMDEPWAADPSKPKKVAVAEAINQLLYELVLRCIKDPDEGIRYYYDVGVIGYSNHVGPALGGALAGKDLVSIVELGNNPLRVDSVTRDDGDGPRSVRSPVWFDPFADGLTSMSTAVNYAGSLLSPWSKQHMNSFPPIVINISDGAATDEEQGDPRVWAERLRTISTNDGGCLFFNLSVSALSAQPIVFPADPAGLERDSYCRCLFDMSSALPDFMLHKARTMGVAVEPGARGFVYNADMSAVITFLQIGTQGPMGTEKPTL